MLSTRTRFAKVVALARNESGIENIEFIALATVASLVILAIAQIVAPAMGSNLGKAIVDGIMKAAFGDPHGAVASLLAPIVPMMLTVGGIGIAILMIVGLGVYIVKIKHW